VLGGGSGDDRRTSNGDRRGRRSGSTPTSELRLGPQASRGCGPRPRRSGPRRSPAEVPFPVRGPPFPHFFPEVHFREVSSFIIPRSVHHPTPGPRTEPTSSIKSGWEGVGGGGRGKTTPRRRGAGPPKGLWAAHTQPPPLSPGTAQSRAGSAFVCVSVSHRRDTSRHLSPDTSRRTPLAGHLCSLHIQCHFFPGFVVVNNCTNLRIKTLCAALIHFCAAGDKVCTPLLAPDRSAPSVGRCPLWYG